MKRYSLLFALAILLLTTSCDKDDNPVDNNNTNQWKGRIIYDRPGSGIEEYNFNTRKTTSIASEGYYPQYIGNNKIIYINQLTGFYRDQFVVADYNGASKQVVFELEQGHLAISTPRVSNDGSYFSLTVDDAVEDFGIESGMVIIDDEGNIVGGFEDLYDGSWTPDNRLVLAGSFYVGKFYPNGDHTGANPGLYITDATFENAYRIDENLNNPKHPAVSPDGSKIAFSMNNDIWIINLDGTGLRQLTTGNKQEKKPVWSPDGKFIAMQSHGSFEDDTFTALAVVPANSTAPVAMENNANVWPFEDSGKDRDRLNPNSDLHWFE